MRQFLRERKKGWGGLLGGMENCGKIKEERGVGYQKFEEKEPSSSWKMVMEVSVGIKLCWEW